MKKVKKDAAEIRDRKRDKENPKEQIRQARRNKGKRQSSERG